jgi:hypothetical protein
MQTSAVAVAAWPEEDSFRACALCDHGPLRGGQPGCCTLHRRPVLVSVMRRPDGACGPEAVHMRIDGWDLH